jgi:hypothetical protein
MFSLVKREKKGRALRIHTYLYSNFIRRKKKNDAEDSNSQDTCKKQ